jgi:hypothetical protein
MNGPTNWPRLIRNAVLQLIAVLIAFAIVVAAIGSGAPIARAY